MNEMDMEKEKNLVFATQDGDVKAIEEMNDPVFAQKALGDGVCMIPSDKNVYSPIKGKLAVVADTKHAYGIIGEDGLEIMIHVGIDSVELDGRGITSYVSVEENVEVGTLLCSIDFDVFNKENISTETAVVITNKDKFEIINKNLGLAKAKENYIFQYIKK